MWIEFRWSWLDMITGKQSALGASNFINAHTTWWNGFASGATTIHTTGVHKWCYLRLPATITSWHQIIIISIHLIINWLKSITIPNFIQVVHGHRSKKGRPEARKGRSASQAHNLSRGRCHRRSPSGDGARRGNRVDESRLTELPAGRAQTGHGRHRQHFSDGSLGVLRDLKGCHQWDGMIGANLWDYGDNLMGMRRCLVVKEFGNDAWIQYDC